VKRVLHLTPHLGGGVGRALANLVGPAARFHPSFRHEVVCFEPPQKPGAFDRIAQANVPITVSPGADELAALVARADIVQLEFWNHPATLRALCAGPLPPMRLVVWCHINGLHWPRIPPGLVASAHRFLFTAPASADAAPVPVRGAAQGGRPGVVTSGAGLEALPAPPARAHAGPLRLGYVGSLNFAKLHPDYVALVGDARDPARRIRMIGDPVNRGTLERQCRQAGVPGLLEFLGFRADVASELGGLDVLVYLLNPFHYGTAENALLEAMAMGVVPIVWNNRAETDIVRHGHTGIVVSDRPQLLSALDRLANDPQWRFALAAAAAEEVRSRYTLDRLGRAFAAEYDATVRRRKSAIDFRECFGHSPADWFLSFAPPPDLYGSGGAVRLPDDHSRFGMLERTKGSVFHFDAHFPDTPPLCTWAAQLESRARATA
jgi:glycosyltransferase involved in cell wall biosynthesis